MAVYASPSGAEEGNTAAQQQKQPPPQQQPSANKKKKAAAAAAAAAAASSSSTVSSSSSSSSSSPLLRYLYYKLHSVSAAAAAAAEAAGDDSALPGCTLFVVNIPFYYTSEHLTQLFSVFGSIAHVLFLQSHSDSQLSMDLRSVGPVEKSNFYRSAKVVYEEAASAEMACHTDLSQMPQQCPEEEEDDKNVGMKSP